MKTGICQLFVRSLLGLVALTLVVIGLLWTRPLDMQTATLNWRPPAQGSWSLGCVGGGGGDAAAKAEERGVGLLHTWTDSELFRRVKEAEDKLSSSSRNSSDSASSKKKRTPKIAFMFLCQDGLPFAPLWNKFFKGHEDLYNIYVHMWPLRLSTIQRNGGVFYGRLIPSQEGQRLTPGLIADGRRLLANALLDDPSNEWFAMISESCIPIHGFRHVYKSLGSTDKTYMNYEIDQWR